MMSPDDLRERLTAAAEALTATITATRARLAADPTLTCAPEAVMDQNGRNLLGDQVAALGQILAALAAQRPTPTPTPTPTDDDHAALDRLLALCDRQDASCLPRGLPSQLDVRQIRTALAPRPASTDFGWHP